MLRGKGSSVGVHGSSIVRSAMDWEWKRGWMDIEVRYHSFIVIGI